jgi:hypothetical protein
VRRTWHQILLKGLDLDEDPPPGRDRAEYGIADIMEISLREEGISFSCHACNRRRMTRAFLVEYADPEDINRLYGHPCCAKKECARTLRAALRAWVYQRTIAILGPTSWHYIRPRYAKQEFLTPIPWETVFAIQNHLQTEEHRRSYIIDEERYKMWALSS